MMIRSSSSQQKEQKVIVWCACSQGYIMIYACDHAIIISRSISSLPKYFCAPNYLRKQKTSSTFKKKKTLSVTNAHVIPQTDMLSPAPDWHRLKDEFCSRDLIRLHPPRLQMDPSFRLRRILDMQILHSLLPLRCFFISVHLSQPGNHLVTSSSLSLHQFHLCFAFATFIRANNFRLLLGMGIDTAVSSLSKITVLSWKSVSYWEMYEFTLKQSLLLFPLYNVFCCFFYIYIFQHVLCEKHCNRWVICCIMVYLQMHYSKVFMKRLPKLIISFLDKWHIRAPCLQLPVEVSGGNALLLDGASGRGCLYFQKKKNAKKWNRISACVPW